MEIKKYRGGYAIDIPQQYLQKYLNIFNHKINSDWINDKNKRDPNYHITIISSNEINNENKILIDSVLSIDGNSSGNSSGNNSGNSGGIGVDVILILGLGLTDSTAFLTCHCPTGDEIRKKLKLPSKWFHITLGFNTQDNHYVDKSVRSILPENIITENVIQLINHKTVDKSKWVIMLSYFIIKANICGTTGVIKYEWLYQYAISLANIKKFNEVYGFIGYLIEFHPWLGYYVKTKIDLFHGIKPSLHDIDEIYLKISTFSINDSLQYTNEYQQFIDLLNSVRPIDSKVYYYWDDNTKSIGVLATPRNFSKINIPDNLINKEIINKENEQPIINLYGSGMLTSNNLQFIKYIEIDTIIGLTETIPPVQKNLVKQYQHFPIDDECPPDLCQCYKIVEKIDTGKNVVVHCVGGKGRTNTVIIAYLIWKYEISVSDALDIIKDRLIILTDLQTKFLKNFYVDCQKTKFIKHIKCDGDSPNVIVLVGLSGSGKSTFTNHLKELAPDIINDINQDNMGRGNFMIGLTEHMSNIYCPENTKNIMIVDRCNLTKNNRQAIFEGISKYKIRNTRNIKVWCIWFDLSIDEVMLRCQLRENHPTLSASKSTSVILEQNSKFEVPDVSEGFDKIFHIKDEEQINDLLTSWKLPSIKIENSSINDYYKFPRTHHVYSLGGASRDDLVMTQQESEAFLNRDVIVEEKVDGANLGISIEPDTYKILFQNRSHYITHNTHSQFKKLSHWAEQHSSQLFDILEPGRHILFGEWLYSKHTVAYNQLPNYFVVFDLYDKKQKQFYSRKHIEKLLEKTDLPLVPLVFEGKLTSKKDVIDLLDTISKYGDEKIEGLYIKIISDDGSYVINRGKVVRPNFINDHFWTYDTVPNILKY
jgi:protein-tyrosine phosphatase/energy-coupling factor transporter ATP-binding protein EcfA2